MGDTVPSRPEQTIISKHEYEVVVGLDGELRLSGELVDPGKIKGICHALVDMVFEGGTNLLKKACAQLDDLVEDIPVEVAITARETIRRVVPMAVRLLEAGVAYQMVDRNRQEVGFCYAEDRRQMTGIHDGNGTAKLLFHQLKCVDDGERSVLRSLPVAEIDIRDGRVESVGINVSDQLARTPSDWLTCEA